MLQRASVSVLELPNYQPPKSDLAKLKARMLAAQTINQLHALIVEYSHQELNQVYNQLTPVQKSQIDAVCQRESLV